MHEKDGEIEARKPSCITVSGFFDAWSPLAGAGMIMDTLVRRFLGPSASASGIDEPGLVFAVGGKLMSLLLRAH